MERKLLVGLALLGATLNTLDNWTTYLCLRNPVQGFVITEANPVARFTFEQMGLVPGLVFEYALTLLALVFVVWTHRLPGLFKVFLLGVLCLLAGGAAWNNFQVIQEVGLDILGGS